jgi:hypothetical protein
MSNLTNDDVDLCSGIRTSLRVVLCSYAITFAENERLVVIQVLEVINGSSKKVKFLLTDATVHQLRSLYY